MNRIDAIDGLNGTVKRTRKPAKRQPRRSTRARWWTTVSLGVGIPALSLALSCVGGRLLAEQHEQLGTAALVLCCSVLAVSLSHLAWSVRDITRCQPWQAWALAVAIDSTLIVGELATVHGFDSALVPVLMASVAVASAWLNVWGFTRHCS
jgi:hypothetical protein